MFKYYLRYKYLTSWKYYYVDSGGNVLSTSTKTPITFAPKGWREKALKWERGFVYHGVFQTFSIPLEFVKDGGKILRHLYYNGGTEPECQLFIEKFNNTIAVYNYEDYYYGDIDFSRLNDRKDFVICEIMEGGFMSKLKAKETTNTELDVVDSPNRVWVKMDGMELLAIFTFVGLNQPEDNVTNPTYITVNGINIPTLLFVNTDGYSNGDHIPKGNTFIATYNDFFRQINTGIISVSMGDKWFIQNNSDSLSYTYNIKGSMKIGTISGTNNTKCRLRMLRFAKDTSTIIQNHSLADGIAYASFTIGVEEIPFDSNITLAPNQCLIFHFFYDNNTGATLHQTHLFDCKMIVSVLNRVPTTYIPALRTFDIFDKLIDGIDTDTTPQSTLLQTTEKKKVLTSGDALRNLEKSKMSTNISDFYKSVNSVFNTCMKFDKSSNIISISNKIDAYDPTQIVDLGEVSNLVITPFTSEMFAKLKIGYKDVKVDEYNGKDEPNTLFEFQSPLIRVTNEKDLTGEYLASIYIIELTRANLTGKLLADNSSDNEIFWLDIESSIGGVVPAGLVGAGENYYNLDRSGYTISQGLISPYTAFNLTFSPKLRLFKHGNWINSVLYPQYNIAGSKISFQTSSKTQNNDDYLQWIYLGNAINEKQDELLTDLDAPFLFPILFEFDCLIPQNILTLMASNPYGVFKFEYNGLSFYGFLISVQDEPATKAKQSYKLLCATSTNLNNLIV